MQNIHETAISSVTKFYLWCVMMVLASFTNTNTHTHRGTFSFSFLTRDVCEREVWEGMKAGESQQRKDAKAKI